MSDFGNEVYNKKQLVFACLSLVALITLLAMASLPSGFLNGAAPFWTSPKGDFAEYIIAARYFIADAWRWPLLFVATLGLPQGTNIGLTDNVPLAALAAKLLRGVAGTGWNYIPGWSLICFCLQGPACAIALYVLGVRRFAALVLGGLLAVFMPVFFYQFPHAAVDSHFSLLLALAIHLYLIQHWSRLTLLWYLPLLAVTLLINIYLFAMVFAIALASILHGLWIERMTIAGGFSHLAVMAIEIVLLMWACGYLALGQIPLKPYGENALDLAAPFTPGPSGLFGLNSLSAGRPIEDFAYFGAGLLLLIGAAAVSWRRRLAEIAITHVPTVVMAIGLIVFAVSYGVHIGPVLILGISPEQVRTAVIEVVLGGSVMHSLRAMLTVADFLRIGVYVLGLAALFFGLLFYSWRRGRRRFVGFVLIASAAGMIVAIVSPHTVALVISNFQSSARFVWIVLYLVMLLAIAAVWQSLRPSAALVLLAGALGLQIAETAVFWQAIREDAKAQPDAIADESILQPAIASARRVILVPTYLCAYSEFDNTPQRDLLVAKIVDLQVLVSQSVKPINSFRNSRMTAVDTGGLTAACEANRREALSHVADSGSLTLVLDGAPAEADLRRELAGRPECHSIQTGVFCLGLSE